jgi:hypothetical protein
MRSGSSARPPSWSEVHDHGETCASGASRKAYVDIRHWRAELPRLFRTWAWLLPSLIESGQHREVFPSVAYAEVLAK